MSEGTGRARWLVLCLGNAIRRDDGVGWRVAEALLAAPPAGVEVRMTALSGLYLLDEMEGFDRVVIVDALASGESPPGTVSAFSLGAVRAAPGPSPHGMGLPSALRAAQAMGAPIPSRVEVVAVEVSDLATVGVGLTPAVAAAVPIAAARVRELVAEPAPGSAAFLSGAARGDGLSASRWFP